MANRKATDIKTHPRVTKKTANSGVLNERPQFGDHTFRSFIENLPVMFYAV